MNSSILDSNRNARTAGLLYLISVVTGMFSLAYVPSQIAASGDAQATVANIIAHKALFQLGIVSELIDYTAWLLLVLTLYRLLAPVHKSAAVIMVAVATISIPIALGASAHQFDVLSLLGEPTLLRTFAPGQLNANVMLSLTSYDNALLVCEAFWGLWLLPFGYLVFKSGFLPRILGILLMIGCFSYLVDFAASCMKISAPAWVILPASLGEVGICLWLLVMGAGRQARNAAGKQIALR